MSHVIKLKLSTFLFLNYFMRLHLRPGFYIALGVSQAGKPRSNWRIVISFSTYLVI